MAPGTEQRAAGAWAGAALLIATWISAFIDRMILMPLVPGMKSSLGLSDTDVALLFGPAFSIVFAFAGLPLGRLVDRANRRRLLLAALVGWSIASVAAGLATDFATLFVARMGLGIAQAALAPATFSLIADLFPVEQRGRPTALLIAASAIGSALANVLGGVLLQAFGTAAPLVLPGYGALAPWQATLIVTALPGLAVLPFYLAVREPARRSSDIATPAAAGRVSIVPYLLRYRRLFAPMLAAMCCNLVIGIGLGSWFVPLLMRNGGLRPADAGILVGGLTLVTAALAATVGGWASDRAARHDAAGGRLRLMGALLLIESASLLLLLAGHSAIVLALAFLTFGLLTSVISACSYAILPDLVPPQARGQFVAVYQLLGNLVGLGLGPTLVGLLTDHVFGDPTKLNLAMVAIGVPAALLAAALLALSRPHVLALHAAVAGGKPPP